MNNEFEYKYYKTKEEIDINSGLSEQEQKVMGKIVDAWNEFMKLEVQRIEDNGIFCDAIHQCQSVLATRIVRRDYPNYWTTDNN